MHVYELSGRSNRILRGGGSENLVGTRIFFASVKSFSVNLFVGSDLTVLVKRFVRPSSDSVLS